MLTYPDCAIIIPHFNDSLRLGRCLAALLPQVTPGTELRVIDNGSTQSLAPVRAAHPALRIVTEPREGAANARNRGVAETTAPCAVSSRRAGSSGRIVALGRRQEAVAPFSRHDKA